MCMNMQISELNIQENYFPRLDSDSLVGIT